MNPPEISLEILRERITTFITEREWDQFHSCKNLALSIMLEAAELVELFQWIDPTFEDVKSNYEFQQKVIDELADIIIYVISFANKFDLNFGAEIVAKLKKNAEKYPIPDSIGRADKYHSYFSLKD